MVETEYVVRLAPEQNKNYNVMRFNANLNIDVTKLSKCKMERETLFKEVKEEAEDEKPEFGAGSEFGRKEKEEARRRKYQKRKKQSDNSPWILKVGGKQGKKYRGLRDGGVGENSSFYIFFQAPDGAFEAYPVNEWYNFTPFQRYKPLSAEEAEEKFTKRDQILNYFQLRNMKGGGEGTSTGDEAGKKNNRAIKKEFKVSDMDDWDINSGDDDNASDGDSDDEDRKPKDKKGKKIKKEKRKKKNDSDQDDDEPLEESDEGDFDDKEVDYMSDSSSSSESDVEKGDIKGVEDESALRDLVVSEDEDEQEETKEENKEQTEENKPNENETKNVKVKGDKNPNDSISDSEFDSDNSDMDDSKSALLIQPRKAQKAKLDNGGEQGSSKSEAAVNGTSSNNNGIGGANGTHSSSSGLKFKHKLDQPAGTSHVAKKQKLDKAKSEPADGISEDAVRRYLMRKPMTAKDLLQKFKKSKVNQSDNRVAIIAEILKKLNPVKQTINDKLYFSLKPT